MVTETFFIRMLMMTSARVHGSWVLMLSMLMKESFVVPLGPQVDISIKKDLSTHLLLFISLFSIVNILEYVHIA